MNYPILFDGAYLYDADGKLANLQRVAELVNRAAQLAEGVVSLRRTVEQQRREIEMLRRAS